MAAAAPELTDEWIDERWPDQDRAEIRRRFAALMDRLGDSPWRGIPRWPEVMQPVLAWAAQLPRERLQEIASQLANVPPHLRDQIWVAGRQAFGEQRVNYEDVSGDNGHGMGRQAVAITPYVRGYNLAPWIAATSPGNVAALLAYVAALETLAKDLMRGVETAGSALSIAQPFISIYARHGDLILQLSREPEG